MDINRRGLDAGVTQDVLDGEGIRSGFSKPSSGRMA
jgi:hypothetical protein